MSKNHSKMPKHGKSFARLYVDNGGNMTQAARELPGVSESSAETIGRRLYGNVRVRSEIERLQSKLDEKCIITKQKLIDEWARIAFADPADVMSWNPSGIDMIPSDQISADKRRLIKSISHHTSAGGESFKVEMVDRDSAKKELAKLLGYYPKEGTGETVIVNFSFGGE